MHLALSTALLAAAIVCVALLARWSGLGPGDIGRSLATCPFWLPLAFVALTLVQITLSALKWQNVLNAMIPQSSGGPTFRFYLACSAASALLSQIMTTYLSSIVTRSWAARRFFSVPLGKGATSSAYEQIFDVAVLVFMAVPTVVVLIFGGSLTDWILALAAAILAGLLCLLGFGRAISVLVPLLTLHAKTRPLADLYVSGQAGKLFSESFIVNLFGLSVLRYFVMMVRAPLVIIGLGLPIGAGEAAQGFTLVQTTQLAAFTPGNLGIQEWSWTGVLAFLGYDMSTGADFAIALRVIGLVTLTLAALLVLMPTMFSRRMAA